MEHAATLLDAYRLFQEGVLALSCVEEWGMRIDVSLLERTEKEVSETINSLTNDLKNTDVWRHWKRRFSGKSNLGSGPQLAKVLTEDMGFVIESKTEKIGREKTDEKALSFIDHPFIPMYFRRKKLLKLRDTYLAGIRRELVGEYIHPSFNLHLVESQRSSCDSPNVQNQIRRDAEFAERLRKLFVPSPGCVLLEADMSAHEFRVYACVCGDEKMQAYASDPTKDIHRDVASECYLLDLNQDWSGNKNLKKVRGEGKNKFVFPTLYGSYYKSTARDLWTAVDLENLTTANGESLYSHLASKGITSMGKCDPKLRDEPPKGTFERHIYEVDKRFHSRFPQWDNYVSRTMSDYQKRGYFDMVTGFRCSGVFTKNQVLNYKTQGPAFHIVLWSLIQMVKWIRKNKLKSRVICEIHDSIIMDVCKNELEDVVCKLKQVMTKDVRRHWPWIVVPLDIEVDVCEENWFGKKRLAV